MGSYDSKKIGKRLARFEIFTKIFNVLMYVAMGIVALLFLILGMSWLLNFNHYNSGGGGMVMAFVYIGPIAILNILNVFLFVCIKIVSVRLRKYDPDGVTLEYERSRRLFVREFILSIVANIIIFIPSIIGN